MTGEWHPAFEEYCEAIFELDEDDVDVIRARIADRLGISRPAVSEMIKRLQAEGLVVTEPRISLTLSGAVLAERVVRRHRLAECFLTQILGLSWAEAHREAGKWEHVMSESVERAINAMLGGPTTCPHGNPIPGSDYVAQPVRRLGDLPEGTTFIVARIPEELEFAPGMLDFLEQSAITPGTSGQVAVSGADGSVQVEIGGRRVGVDEFASRRILVTV